MTKDEARKIAYAIRRKLQNHQLIVGNSHHEAETTDWKEYDRFLVEGTVTLDAKDACWEFIAQRRQMPHWDRRSDEFTGVIGACFHVEVPYITENETA